MMLNFGPIILLYCIDISLGANILYLAPFRSKSHGIFLKPIGLELARRGHNVTVLTSSQDLNPPRNYNQIVIEVKGMWEYMGTKRPNVYDSNEMTAIEFINKVLWVGGLAYTENILNSTEFQQFLSKNNKFDLVICEALIQEALYALAHKYSAPLVLVTAFGNCMRHNLAVGNPLQLATTLYEFLAVEDPTSFLGRLENLYTSLYEFFWWRFWYLYKQEELVRKYIPNLAQPVPSLYEMQRNASLFLINSHFSFDSSVPYLPNIIEIGGIHTHSDDRSIPRDIEKILNDSKDGVVYVNFGSNIRSSELPPSKRKVFLTVFGRLNKTVLWKWEDNNTQDMPLNVATRKWFPQNKILSHSNIKLFIGHGGLMSTQEAVFHGVPILGIPIYADQYNNLLLAQEIGFGKILKYRDINEESLDNAINDILQNNDYMNKAKAVSKRFKDRPMNPAETALFWIEYVLRNDGAHHMKSSGFDMHWLVYNMLDVYIFILILLLASMYLLYKVISVLAKLSQSRVVVRLRMDKKLK
ncbi:unnamed protein product [Leptosia nina]|uniref:UDP-glucuronosyltransferase n=1 Tax=Leptosia nina TaxID=320188 RepID=A0AAV1K3L8_9NEOP